MTCHEKASQSLTVFFPDSVALSDILEAFRLPENIKRIREAQDNSGNDMLKTMQIVFPLATVIQMEIMPKYGFTGDGDG